MPPRSCARRAATRPRQEPDEVLVAFLQAITIAIAVSIAALSERAVAATDTLAALPAPQDLTGTLRKIRESGSITIGHREASVPFSYLDERQQPIGYSMDICAAIVEEVKKELQLSTLAVKYNMVTPQTRIALVSNGSVDLECGSTTNTLTRQRQVAFAPITFITGTKLLVKKASKIKNYKDLRNKTVVVTQGTTNERLIKALSERENLNIKFLNAKDHGESFLTVESGRAAAFSMDDILLYGLQAKAKNPKDYEIVGDYLSYEPYGVVFRANDDAFGMVVRRAVARFFGEAGVCNGPIRTVYRKWFVDKLPSGETIGVPMSPMLEMACRTNALPD
jgi:glutamate/aspartate transport system substrate-binding protein